MEEEKAAAYYDELSRKGSGAARFKQGLGFSTNDAALPSSSSFLNTFVKASTGVSQNDEVDKESQLQSIQNKLKSKSKSNNKIESQRSRNEIQNKSQRNESQRSRSRRCDRDEYRDSKLRGRSRSRDRDSRRRSRERYESRRSRHGNKSQRDPDRDKYRNSKRRSRSRSGSGSDSGRRSRSRERSSRRRSRSRSRGDEGRGRGRRNETFSRGEKSVKDEEKGRVDYTKLIQGYDQMAPAERVKAKMKLQLTETAKNDPTRGTGSGWERFDFDKDATLDDEEEIEAAEDDRALVKHIGQSFRFSAIEARKEDQIKAAHDEAMFGAPTLQPTPDTDEEKEDSPKCANDTAPDTSLISNQVISMQQVAWRDRLKKM